MRLLLDTSAFIVATTEPERLGRHRAALEDTRNERLVSAVVGWEIAIKWHLGRVDLPEAPQQFVVRHIERGRMTPVPIELSAALGVADLPDHHRDPFDRLLIYTALQLKVAVLTSDPLFEAYGVEVLRFDRGS